MSSASIHDKLSRVRKPRVHITYQVETEGAKVEKELPFVVGVLGDFSGHPTEPLKPLRNRKFVQIDRDNFDEIMTRMTPGANTSLGLRVCLVGITAASVIGSPRERATSSRGSIRLCAS